MKSSTQFPVSGNVKCQVLSAKALDR